VIPTSGAVFDGMRLVVTDELLVREAGPGEATVRVVASGICHSDLNVLDGTSPVPLPVVLGHEAAGIVERVGDGVSSVQPGDAVIVGSMVPCGVCRACAEGRSGECRDAFGPGATPFIWRGEPVRAYANVASFAGMVTVRADQLVASADLPPTSAALVGCAVSTGYGVVRNVARVRAGDTVVVFGVGGIGVNALQTARLQGAAQIVAVDVNPGKAATAARFGADTFVAAPRTAAVAELVDMVRAHTTAPIDAVIECSGALVAIEAAIGLAGWGGTIALVGIPPAGARASFDVGALLRNRRIVGSLNGTVDVQRDFAAIVASVQNGELELDAQVSRVWPLAEIDDAIATVRAGEVVRAVLDHTAR
jgi:S-(hydroxymethyl)glutathione dehydrogenase / alcohol dehydrogenase